MAHVQTSSLDSCWGRSSLLVGRCLAGASRGWRVPFALSLSTHLDLEFEPGNAKRLRAIHIYIYMHIYTHVYISIYIYIYLLSATSEQRGIISKLGDAVQGRTGRRSANLLGQRRQPFLTLVCDASRTGAY